MTQESLVISQAMKLLSRMTREEIEEVAMLKLIEELKEPPTPLQIIDKNKHYITREGMPAVIYSVLGGGEYPVHGAYMQEDGTWAVCDWTAEGNINASSMEGLLDLMEVR